MWLSILRQVLPMCPRWPPSAADCPCAHWHCAGRSRLAWLTSTTGVVCAECPWSASLSGHLTRGCPDLGQVRTTLRSLGGRKPAFTPCDPSVVSAPVSGQAASPVRWEGTGASALGRVHPGTSQSPSKGVTGPQHLREAGSLGREKVPEAALPAHLSGQAFPGLGAGQAAALPGWTFLLAAASGHVPCSGRRLPLSSRGSRNGRHGPPPFRV